MINTFYGTDMCCALLSLLISPRAVTKININKDKDGQKNMYQFQQFNLKKVNWAAATLKSLKFRNPFSINTAYKQMFLSFG